MNPNDPFSALGGERTIIKPRLGKPVSSAIQSLDNILEPGRTPAHKIEHSQGLAQAQFEQTLNQLKDNPDASSNPLLAHISPVLRMVCAAGSMAEMPSLKALSCTWSKELSELDQQLEKLGRPQAERLSVRYVLCTFMDERAANTPWGGSGSWAPHSLLLQFFSETWGGEKVFALIQKVMQSPSENRDLLEVMAVVLSLGFKGRYHVENDGEIALSQLRHRLFQLLKSSSLDPLTPLHPPFWKSRAPASLKRLRQIPLWLPVSILSAAGTALFILLYFNMNTQSDHAFAEITSISFPAPEFSQVEVVPVIREQAEELSVQLKEEIAAGLLTLKQTGNKSVVLLVGDGLFQSGSAELNPRAIPLVEKVAKELSLHPGQIKVTGYTDNQPIRSIRFPSNWQLSSERAQNVGKQIAPFLPDTAIATEGAGAANPIAPSNTAQGRALNRRVEITFLHTR